MADYWANFWCRQGPEVPQALFNALVRITKFGFKKLEIIGHMVQRRDESIIGIPMGLMGFVGWEWLDRNGGMKTPHFFIG